MDGSAEARYGVQLSTKLRDATLRFSTRIYPAKFAEVLEKVYGGDLSYPTRHSHPTMATMANGLIARPEGAPKVGMVDNA